MSTLSTQSLIIHRVSNIALQEVCSVGLTTSIRDVVQTMVQKKAECVLVMDGNVLAGIFTERDFLNRVVARSIDTSRWIHEVMTTEPKTIDSHVPVLSAIELMQAGNYRHLPVVGANRRPVGVLSVRDLVHYVVERLPAEEGAARMTAASPQLAFK